MVKEAVGDNELVPIKGTVDFENGSSEVRLHLLYLDPYLYNFAKLSVGLID